MASERLIDPCTMEQMITVDGISPIRRKTDLADLVIVVVCGLGLALTGLFLAVMPLMHSLAGSRDYVVYWATGQQLAHHANPYDPDQMGQLEHEAGLTSPGSYYMRNPPWALPLAYPLGFIPERLGALPWSLLMLGLLAISVRMFCRTVGAPKGEIAMLGFCFPPALITVVAGQTSIFVLLGLVLFLALRDRRPYLAGSALWLCSLKPHLLLLFGLVLLAWMIRNRNYKIIVGFAVTLAVSCLLTEWIDPAAWRQYLQWSQHSGIQTEFIPCLAVLLRQSISPARSWLAFAPAILGCLWAVGFYWRRRDRWDWLGDGGVLVLTSLLLAPYCFIYDQTLALPALLHSAYQTTSRRVLGALGLLYILIQVMELAAIGNHSALYLWPAFAWPVWNLIARRHSQSRAASGPEELVMSSGLPGSDIRVESCKITWIR
jgi:Glycosyltransferase family 87